MRLSSWHDKISPSHTAEGETNAHVVSRSSQSDSSAFRQRARRRNATTASLIRNLKLLIDVEFWMRFNILLHMYYLSDRVAAVTCSAPTAYRLLNKDKLALLVKLARELVCQSTAVERRTSATPFLSSAFWVLH